MIQDKTFIITASRMWDEPYGNDARAMAEEIALHNRVLYVNPPANGVILPVAELTEGAPAADGGTPEGYEIRCPGPNLWILDPRTATVPVNKVRSDAAFDMLNENNSILFANTIKSALSGLGFDWDETYLLLCNDLVLSSYLPELLPARMSLFYRNDQSLPESISPRRAAKLKYETAKGADIVVTNSTQLAYDLRQYNYNTFNIGKGMDLDGYEIGRNYPRPADIADIKTPIIGCAGTISSLYISPAIIYQIGLSFPEATVVLLGKRDPLLARHPAHELPNVRFLGIKSEQELPAYISAFDVCIDPAINRHPKSRYRDAIVYYLALGKTVVCTDMEHTTPFRDFVMVARSEKEFIEKVMRGLHIRTPWSIRYKRAEFASTFSWSKCVERLYVVINMAETERIAKNGGQEGRNRP